MTLSLLKAEFYRMKITKAVTVLLIIYSVLTLLSVIGLGVLYGNAKWLLSWMEFLKSADESALYSLTVFRELIPEMLGEADTICAFVSKAFSIQAPLFATVFTAVYSIAPFRTSFVKNYRTEVNPKAMMASMFVTLFFYTSLLSLIPFVTGLSFVWLFYASGTAFGNFASLAAFYFVKGLLLYATGMLILTLTMIFRRPTAAIILSIIYTAGIANSFYSITDTILLSLLEYRYSVSDFTTVGNFLRMGFGDHERYFRAFLIAAIAFAAAYLLINRALKRKDIN